MSVAGVRLPDSRLSKRSAELAGDAYPPYLFNHAMRTYVFGALIGMAGRQRFDEEILFVACTLHDLGLTSRFEGDLPFEIQGAEAARRFLQSHNVGSEKSEIIWDAIAMHASPIAPFKRAEISLVSAGAAADVLGMFAKPLRDRQIAEIVEVFPRMNFKKAFLRTCAGVVQRHRGGASRSFMRDIGERFVPCYRPPNFCDLLERAPFPE